MSKKWRNRYVFDDKGVTLMVVNRKGQSKQFIFDFEDYKKIHIHQWFNHNGYCTRMENQKQIPVTWDLMGKPSDNHVWHHVNRNRGDNRKNNLQYVSQSVNNFHKKTKPNCSTGRRGISKYANGTIVVLCGLNGERKCRKTMQEALELRRCF